MVTPTQGYHAGPPPYSSERTVGLRAWVALLIVAVILVAVWFIVGAAVPNGHADAAAGGPGATPSQSVDTRTRAATSTAPRTYADPLPAALRPGWKVSDLDVEATGDYSGIYTGATPASYAAWIVKLRKAGFVTTPTETNNATEYDLHKGHARILGDLDTSSTPNTVTFVYDVNGY